MGKDKLRKFDENKTFSHVFEPTRQEVEQGFEKKGKWSEFFGNENPVVVELGCGKGEYTVNLARMFPEKNFIGIDIKGARIWRGAKTAKEDDLNNVAFVRTQIELIENVFAENEVSEIWITFPDPQIKFRRAKHRLTHPNFLRSYYKITKDDSLVHLKTDSEFLHGYTLGVLQIEDHQILKSNHDVYHPHTVDVPQYVTGIQTFYESKYLEENKAITYIQFRLNH